MTTLRRALLLTARRWHAAPALRDGVQVAREAVLRFRPNARIVAHHDNVKSPQFGTDFFSRFAVVLNGLDNMDARRHVNGLCLAAGVPLVESGTAGYLGQARQLAARRLCAQTPGP